VAGNEVGSVSPSGRFTASVYDAHGNRLLFADEGGRVTRYTYADDRCVSETDPRGSVTSRAFDSRGNLLSRARRSTRPGGQHFSCYTYAPDGRLLSESRGIDSRTEALTEYGDFADSGVAQTTRVAGRVSLRARPPSTSSAASSSTPTETCWNRPMQQAALSLETSTTPRGGWSSPRTPGTVAHYRFGPLGSQTEVWRSNPSTASIAGWRCLTYDGAGHVVAETSKATDGSNGLDHVAPLRFGGSRGSDG